MATKSIAWNTGSGNISIDYTGEGNGTIEITSDNNNLYEARSQRITVRTTDGSDIQRTITIQQAAKVRIDISSAIVTAANQTYSGSAKTPTPTVTLNGATVPSSSYDVAYSDNTNAGIATITVTGKNEYTGTATGTFTIAKASRTISFANTHYVQDVSTTATRTATPSAGSGDGALTYSISSTTYATINSSTGAVTSKTSDGSAVVTATIAEGTNYLSATASYNLYVFATTHNYDYNGSYRSVTLPPGTYQFQCWGAQGGSNAAYSSYSITAKAGGKGGYSVGQLTVSQATSIRVYVGGQGSSSAGGYNGGGSTTGTSQYNASDELGYSKMGGGGGATDIRLSDGNLLSRMIVAGGGGGGAMCYRKKTTTTYTNLGTVSFNGDAHPSGSINGITPLATHGAPGVYNTYYTSITLFQSNPFTEGDKIRVTLSGSSAQYRLGYRTQASWLASWESSVPFTSSFTYTVPSSSSGVFSIICDSSTGFVTSTVKFEKIGTSTTETTDSQVGYVGGGTNGGGYSSSYYGKQNGAGSSGSFGQGANQTTTGYRYCSGAGGGGWYGGGGGKYSDSTMSYCRYSGGGSGWVNTAASAGNRPSGYTGLQLDSGSTIAGSSSFPAPGGGNETGHAGNGYARITRL